MDSFESSLGTSNRAWDHVPGSTCHTRPLGNLELKFDQSALNLNGSGQSDIFVSLKVKIDSAEGNEILWKRLLYAWTLLHSIHPLLSATVHNSSLTAASATSTSSSSPSETLPESSHTERCFRHIAPRTDDEAVAIGRNSLLVENLADDLSVELTMERLIQDNVLNTKRVYLTQDECLARLLVVKDPAGEAHMFCLVIAHVISDGLSVILVLKDLFSILSDPSLPTPSTEPSYLSHRDFLSGSLTSATDLSIPAAEEAIRSSWSFLSSLKPLPLASEALYPPLPLPTSTSTHTLNNTVSASPPPSKVRLRWLWAIARVVADIQNQKYPLSLQIPRMNSSSSIPITSWPIIRFSQEDSTSLIKLSKRHFISPSMLLYSIISISISKLLNSFDGTEAIVIGFPYSLRPFLSSAGSELDLAIRITFGSISLPNSPLPSDPVKLEQQVIRFAKLAKDQFSETLKDDSLCRTKLLSIGFLKTLNRFRTSQGKDSWFQDPLSALNASMIGDLDRILPNSFQLPSTTSSITLLEMHIGTRLHSKEGRLTEIYTFNRTITVSLGFDKTLVEEKQTLELLSIIKQIGETLANKEQNR